MSIARLAPAARSSLFLFLLLAGPAVAATAREAAAASTAPAGGGGDSSNPVPRRWNVVIVTADTLRGDKLGVNGHPFIKTPHLDALAREGVNFRRAYTNITTTTPSHATLFSSLYPQDHKAYDNLSKISDAITTLPEILGKAGWHTAGIVNMPWLNPDVSGVSQGIEELARGDHVRKAEKTTAWALDFLDRQQRAERPFYLWVHYVDNHTPYHAPGRYGRLYYPKGRDPRAGRSGSLQEVWPLFPADHRDSPYFHRWLDGITDVDWVIAQYDGSVSWIDANVGRLVDRLKANGQWERTLFVFTADHGESLGEHNLWFCHGGLFEPTTHIPLILHVPGGPTGEVEAIVDLVDVMPTVLAALRLPVPGGLRGENLLPVIESKRGGGAALLDHTGRQMVGVVTPRWKYIRHRKTRTYYPGYEIRRGKIELYDLKNDPKETKNLADSHPEKVRELEALVQKLRQGTKPFEEAAAPIDADTEEALRALGYIR